MPEPRTRIVAWLRELIAQKAPQLVLTPRTDLAMIAVQGPNARGQGLAGDPGQRGGERGAETVHGRDVTIVFIAAPAIPARMASS
jgi:glycine cleavage system aminomethyltransferase T